MTLRSIKMFGKYQQSSGKFDYFVCGVAGALFAYIGQHYSPQKLEFGVSALEPASLLFLATAFFVGLKQIEMDIVIKRINFLMLDAAERAGKLTKALTRGNGPYYNEDGGDILDRRTVESLRLRHLQNRDALKPKLDAAIEKASRFYKVRNFFYFSAFSPFFQPSSYKRMSASKDSIAAAFAGWVAFPG